MIYNLTQEERDLVRGYYPRAPIDSDTKKLILTPLQYITDNHLTLLCSWFYHGPFARTKNDQWILKREDDKIIVRHNSGLYGFHFEPDNGNITFYGDSKMLNLGTQVYATQFYIQFNYAFPIFWANGKTAIELGVAVPNKAPLSELLSDIFNKDRSSIQQWFNDRKLLKVNLDDLDTFNAEYICLKNQVGVAL